MSPSLVLLLALELAKAPAPAGFEAAWDAFRADFAALMKNEAMVGGAVWFFHDGEVVAKELHGLADIETHRAVDDDTIFHWGSVTKMLTGIGIMQLRDRGLLDLDDPVIDYLPKLSSVHNPYGDMRGITIRHVMTHSAGFRAATWPWGGDEPWHPFEPTKWEQLVAMFPYTEVLFPPGSKFRYSNPAVIFLGRIIEEIAGEPYEVYIDKNIFKPLGMHRSYFDKTPPYLLPYRSNNYTVEKGVPHANGLDFDTGITVSNSGLNAPITDLALYAAFLLNLGDAASYETVLRRASLQEMWTPVLPMTDPVANDTGATDYIGLIFFLSERGERTYVGHTGSQAAFQAFLYVEPRSGSAAIAAFNADGASGDAVRKPDAQRVLTQVREQLFRDIFPLFPRR